MSKNITIQEGGAAKQLTANKLKTNLVGGGTCLWVPEDETLLGTKVITEDGTYKAVDDGYYGYSEVSVSGIGTATGTGPDGETHSYTEDGEGGVTDTILPDSITVDTPPTKTSYVDGEIIDYSGMVVKAYLKSGELWTDSAHLDGIIPESELILSVTTASRGGGSVTPHESDGSIVGTPIHSVFISSPIGTGYEIGRVEELDQKYIIETYSELVQIAIINGGYVAAANFNFQGVWVSMRRLDGGGGRGYMMSAKSYTRDGKTVYYGNMSFPVFNVMENKHDAIPVNVISGNPNIRDCAWEMVYTGSSQGSQNIPVQYLRTDSKTLESSFNITVT